MEMVTANLVREGVNKHKARELAEHFYTTPPAQPAPVPLTDEQTTDKDRIDWLNNNFFNRENVDWLTGNVSKKSLMWVFFAPTNVQGDIRRVIDAAMDRDNGITKGQP
jgi:hypothetical protein